MKIGILTFHRAHNYGAVLQCFALYNVLKSLEHDVQVIDYRQAYLESRYQPLNLKFIINHLKHPRSILYYFKTINIRIRKKNIFNSFITKYVNLTKCCNKNIPQDFDIYIIGSDQVWGMHCLNNQKDNIYLGNFKHSATSKIIGYAISTNKESLNWLNDNDLVRYMNNFHKISMREKIMANYISELTNITPEVCIDPTLLAEKEVWYSLANKINTEKKYILIYEVRRLEENPNLLRLKAEELKRITGFEIIDLSNINCSIEAFLSYFKNAQYVITTSFHATVFSIVFNTPFYSIKLNDGHDSRYVDLLDDLGLSNCCIDIDTSITPQRVDFNNANKKLIEYRNDSLQFLKNIY